jgi:hypothetical protein
MMTRDLKLLQATFLFAPRRNQSCALSVSRVGEGAHQQKKPACFRIPHLIPDLSPPRRAALSSLLGVPPPGQNPFKRPLLLFNYISLPLTSASAAAASFGGGLSPAPPRTLIPPHIHTRPAAARLSIYTAPAPAQPGPAAPPPAPPNQAVGRAVPASLLPAPAPRAFFFRSPFSSVQGHPNPSERLHNHTLRPLTANIQAIFMPTPGPLVIFIASPSSVKLTESSSFGHRQQQGDFNRSLDWRSCESAVQRGGVSGLDWHGRRRVRVCFVARFLVL